MKNNLSKIDLCGRPVFISQGEVEQNIAYKDTTDGLFELIKDLFSQKEGCAFNPILVGPTGIGKTTMVQKLSEVLNQPLYTIVGNDEISPEDLLVSASINNEGKFDFIASPLGSAMLTGGICFIDEIGKLRERSMAVLASVLDKRREALSSFLGCTIKAHPNFRFIAATNTSDLEKFDLPDWMKTRLLPFVEYPVPTFEQIEEIVKENFKQPFGEKEREDLMQIEDSLTKIKKTISPGVIVRCWELYLHFKKSIKEEELSYSKKQAALEKAIRYVNWNPQSLPDLVPQ